MNFMENSLKFIVQLSHIIRYRIGFDSRRKFISLFSALFTEYLFGIPKVTTI